MGLVTSLFHDSGYIRETADHDHRNGAEFTLYHVTRSARFHRALPADRGPRELGTDRNAHRALHRLRGAVRSDPSRRSARPQGRPPPRNGGPHRTDGRSLLSREVPRPPVPGVRSRRRRDAAHSRRPHAGKVQLGAGSSAPDADVLRGHARQAPRGRVRLRLPLLSSRCSAARIRTWTRSSATSST